MNSEHRFNFRIFKKNLILFVGFLVSIILILTIFLLVFYSKFLEDSKSANNHISKNYTYSHLSEGYKEFETNFEGDYVMENLDIPKIEDYFNNLNKNGLDFQSTTPAKTATYNNWVKVEIDYENCNDYGCEVQKVTNGYPSKVIYDKYNKQDTFVDYYFRSSNRGENYIGFYVEEKFYYFEKNENGINSFYEDGQFLFSDDLGYGSQGPVYFFYLVDGNPVIHYLVDKSKNSDELNLGIKTWYKDFNKISEFTSQGLTIHRIFKFNNNLGFLIENEKEGFYVVYNSKKLTRYYDQINLKGCCSYLSYPFSIDENGILFFMAKDKGKFYFIEIDLKKF